jgi:hypothetical protein
LTARVAYSNHSQHVDPGEPMPRVIVTSAPLELPHAASIHLDELVGSVHPSTEHGAMQLVERLAWAIKDAEDAERSLLDRRKPEAREAL